MNKLCLIVGAGPGIGMACAHTFAREGYDIALVARRPERLTETAAEIQAKSGRTVRLYQGDAGDETALIAAIAQVRQQMGDPEVAIYNAAGAQLARPLALPVARAIDEFRTNVLGALVMAQQVAPAMSSARRGTILFTGGGFANEPAANYSSLSLGKAALRNLAYSLAQEMGHFGVHVATVTVYGFIQSGTHFDPARIAQTYLRLHRQERGCFEIEAIYK